MNVTKKRISKSFMHRYLSKQIVVEFLPELISSYELSYICHGIVDVSVLPISMINDFKSVYLTAGRNRTEATSRLVLAIDRPRSVLNTLIVQVR